MTEEEQKAILKKTESLWNDRKRLEQLEKENEELKLQIEIEIKKIELIKLKMRNCLNCKFYKTLKPIYESPIYEEDDLPYPCRDCENNNKWELAE